MEEDFQIWRSFHHGMTRWFAILIHLIVISTIWSEEMNQWSVMITLNLLWDDYQTLHCLSRKFKIDVC